MMADYYRYATEAVDGSKKDEMAKQAAEHYESAKHEGIYLPKYNPILLGLALNQAVFYFEVMDDKPKAIMIATGAVADAENVITSAQGEVYRDAKAIMDLLEENIKLWREDDDEESIE